MNSPLLASPYRITLEKKGSTRYTKLSYPTHCGIFTEIVSKSFVLHFNLNGEIIRAQRKGKGWDHPHEWLKRTNGNDWIYYSTGGYTGVFEAIGEYYLPNFTYPTNNLLGGHPFTHREINSLADSWHQILSQLTEDIKHPPETIQRFLTQALANTPERLEAKAERFRTIVGGRISVLPPDARHVDYNLIPLTIADGCLYKCSFCKVKTAKPFTVKTTDAIKQQVADLKNLYAADLPNFNALFLGEHDALQAGTDRICYSIEEAFRQFGFIDSYIELHNTFLFGSVSSLLESPERLFTDLHGLPGMFYINIGLESADQATLDRLGKPISAQLVREAFRRIQEINNRYKNIEITANFIMDENLPANHYPAILELIRETQTHMHPKGAIYFSPITFNQPSRARLFEFHRLKLLSRFPTFLYIIQRL
ncbi:MAG: radical SAM domain-containing protein [Desulforhopalus sp.]|nr:radical SAM domain-containing protein [Desulforhopalus sp.]